MTRVIYIVLGISIVHIVHIQKIADSSYVNNDTRVWPLGIVIEDIHIREKGVILVRAFV